MYKYCLSLLFLFIFSLDARADINVAIVAPQAGEYEKFGNELIHGTKIAVDDINKNGGIRGEFVNLIVVDDQCDEVLSLSTAQMISINSSKKDKVSLVIGPYCADSFEKIADVYAKAKIFQIVPTTIGSNAFDKNHKGLIKMMGSIQRQGDDFFDYYKENFAGQDVSIIYDSMDRKVVDIAVSVQKNFRENGIIEKLKSFDFNNYEDTQTLAKEVINSGSKMAYILGGSDDVYSVFKDIKKKKKYFVIFTNRYQIPQDYKESLGSLAEGSYSFSLPSLKDRPEFTEQLVKFRLLGIEPEGLSLYSYSAIKLWEDMVKKANSFDYEKLSKASKDNSFKTIWGEVIFSNGSPKDVLNYSIYQIQSGQYNQVY